MKGGIGRGAGRRSDGREKEPRTEQIKRNKLNL